MSTPTCAAHCGRMANALGQIPVLIPPPSPPRSAPRRQSPSPPTSVPATARTWPSAQRTGPRTYAAYRNTIEGSNGYVKDTAHEALAEPGRRRVRGIAAQSVFVALLLMAANFRKITAYRQLVADGTAAKVAERARRRRVSLADYRSPP